MTNDHRESSFDGDLPLLGLDPAQIQRVETIQQRHGHAVYRLTGADRSYVLKHFPNRMGQVDIAAYQLLQRYGVPTLTVYGHTPAALLLEDRSTRRLWRHPTPPDIQ